MESAASQQIQESLLLPEINEQSLEWLDAVKNGEDIAGFYMENALFFYEDQKYINGRQLISGFYNNKVELFKGVESISVTYRKQLKENALMVYETGYLTMEDKDVHHYLVIWSKTGGKWLRYLEASALKTTEQNDQSGIDHSRVRWVELSNKHSASELAKELYSEDFIYYNQGNITQGYENLAAVYSYMDMHDFCINLRKDYCENVKNDLSFEIGTYTTPYGDGSYVIIWRQYGGVWKIYLDSNW